MAMLESELRLKIVNAIGTQLVTIHGINSEGNSTTQPGSVPPPPVDSPLVTAIVQVINYIQTNAEVAGLMTITGASGGLVTGTSPAGPITGTLVPGPSVAGQVGLPVTSIK